MPQIPVWATAIFTWACFVDLDRATIEIRAVERLDDTFHGILRTHGHECESTWTTAFAIRRKVDVSDFTMLRERVLKFLARCLEREVSYIHFHNINSGSRTSPSP